MRKPPHVMEIYLQPGEVWVGDRDTRIRTILGSCVAITLWHPVKLIGGMCHFMLAERPPGRAGEPDARYANEAMRLMTEQIRRAGCRLQDMEAKLFGGGRMFRHRPAGGNEQVQDRNIEAGRLLVRHAGAKLTAEHLGGHGHRQLIFDIWNGHVWMKHTPLPANDEAKIQ
ncbi:MAG: chemotaxis protein CheD [Chromatiales bacterium]|jgi:chemotaxis protein CheD|nr:chemotaxis protein CheD [Chromatiales bacterium]MDX9767055.1 chemotaxis protein CheD [Ectothiorhodospiraceae bacterium]